MCLDHLQVAVVIGWVACILICSAIVYGPYSDNGSHVFTEGESVLYEALNRTGWGIAVSWIIFACATGHGGSYSNS